MMATLQPWLNPGSIAMIVFPNIGGDIKRCFKLEPKIAKDSLWAFLVRPDLEGKGHSLMAPVGRWQKNKDLQWFSKDKQNDVTGNVSTEIQKARDAEREAMLIALGQKVGDRLAAETMKPQTDDSLLKLQRSKPAKRKKKQKEKEKKKGKRKNKEIPKKYKNKKSKRKRRDSSDSDETESSSESESDSDSSSDDEREQPAKKRKHSRGKEHRGLRDRDSYHHRDRLDKNSSRTDRDRRKRGSSRERERKKYYDKR